MDLSSGDRLYCCISKSERLRKFLDLRVVALANSYLKKEDTKRHQYNEQLDTYFYGDCGLLQLGMRLPILAQGERYPKKLSSPAEVVG
jgi:hypothetical protein